MTDTCCQTDGNWTDDRMRKYRRMKRKILEFIAKQKSAQVALDKANRKIQALQKEKRRIIRRTKSNDDAMDISEEEEEEEGEADEEIDEEEEDELDEDEDMQGSTNRQPTFLMSKVTKAETVVVKKRATLRRKRVEIPRDENGNVQLPFSIASLTILNLGKVVWDRASFHSERYIWPVGYCVERTYMSMVNPNNQTTYTCKVEEDQDAPLFTIRAADAPDQELSAKTPTGAWALVIKRANEVRHKESANAISGPEYYGFAHPLVIEMIEELDGVDRCSRYVLKREPNGNA
ncbi:transforming growth factor beta regulator 1 [Apophysomyces sp. BC1015]|nr:transforming growth factor beta regulator 1 [Apophysomyces sp. BC1015]